MRKRAPSLDITGKVKLDTPVGGKGNVAKIGWEFVKIQDEKGQRWKPALNKKL